MKILLSVWVALLVVLGTIAPTVWPTVLPATALAMTTHHETIQTADPCCTPELCPCVDQPCHSALHKIFTHHSNLLFTYTPNNNTIAAPQYAPKLAVIARIDRPPNTFC